MFLVTSNVSNDIKIYFGVLIRLNKTFVDITLDFEKQYFTYFRHFQTLIKYIICRLIESNSVKVHFNAQTACFVAKLVQNKIILKLQ